MYKNDCGFDVSVGFALEIQAHQTIKVGLGYNLHTLEDHILLKVLTVYTYSSNVLVLSLAYSFQLEGKSSVSLTGLLVNAGLVRL